MNRFLFSILAGLLIASPVFAGPAASNPELVALAKANDDFSAGQQALDQHDWDQAEQIFDRLAAGGKNADAALYWKAYAQAQAHDYSGALESTTRLAKAYPDSSWRDDADALAVELGRAPHDDGLSDNDELKLYALQAMMISNPDKATAMVKKLIEQGKSDELKKRALFVLTQAKSEDTAGMLSDILMGPDSVPVKVAAVQTLAVIGDKQSLDILDKAYKQADNDAVKSSILQAYMVADKMDRVRAILDQEKDPEIRRQAIQVLAARGQVQYLKGLYDKETDPETRMAIVQGYAIAGDGEMIAKVIKTEKDPEIRATAIKSLVMVHDTNIDPLLKGLYGEAKSEDEKRAILQVLAMHDQVDTLIAIFKQEKDPGIRREILQYMAMFSKSEKASKFIESLVEGK